MSLTIFKRLIISYLIIILMVFIAGVYLFSQLTSLDKIVYYINKVDVPTIRLTKDLKDVLLTQVGFEEKYFVSRDPDFYHRFLKLNFYFLKKLEKLNSLVDADQKIEILKNVREIYMDYTTLFKKNAFKKEIVPSSQYNLKKRAFIREINRDLDELSQMAIFDRDKRLEQTGRISTKAIRVTLITAIICLLTGLFFSFLNTQSINTPIRLLQEETRKIAKGDFNTCLTINSPPEIKELSEAFKYMCEQLKELERMKIDFISHTSHELRTPLTAIREASRMLLEGIFQDDPQRQQELFEIINEECERLIKSVNKILELSRMEAGMMDYFLKPSFIGPLIEKVVFKLNPVAQKKNVIINLELEPNLPQVNMDQEKITEVVENLLDNAIKFTPSGGKITVSAYRNSEGAVEIAVSDTGCGIDQKEMNKVFEEFMSIDKGKSASRGTGLGLSIAKYIVDAHGGKYG